MLAWSPFRGFLVPSILLFTVQGVAPCLLVLVLLKKPASHFAERLNFFGDIYTVTISFVAAGHKCRWRVAISFELIRPRSMTYLS